MIEHIPAYARAIGTMLALVAFLVLAFCLVLTTAGAAVTIATVHNTATYTVGTAPRIRVDLQYGALIVEEGRDGRVVVDDHRSAGSITRAAAGATANQTHVSINQQADQVDIRETNPTFQIVSLGRSAQLRLQVPAHTDLDITSLGNVTVSGIDGNLRIQDSYGNTTLSHVSLRGDSTIDGGTGSVHLDNVTLSGNASLKSAVGDLAFTGSLTPGGTNLGISAGRFSAVSITLPHPTDARATVATRTGNLNPDPIWHFSPVQSGSSRAWTADLGPNPTGTVNVTTEGGNIDFGAR